MDIGLAAPGCSGGNAARRPALTVRDGLGGQAAGAGGR